MEVKMEVTMDDLRSLLCAQSTPQATNTLAGKKVFIRTVTCYYTGRVVAESERWIVLEDAAWIPDTGRFSTALKDGTVNEVEPYPDGAMWINVASIVDVSEWTHDLPRKVK